MLVEEIIPKINPVYKWFFNLTQMITIIIIIITLILFSPFIYLLVHIKINR